MRIDASSPVNFVENGRLVPTLQVYDYDVARKIYFVEVDFSGTLIQPGNGTSFRREAQFRMSLKPGLSAAAWNPSNDPSYSGIQLGGANLLKSDNISVFENTIFLSGKNP
jgi:endoglucanase